MLGLRDVAYKVTGSTPLVTSPLCSRYSRQSVDLLDSVLDESDSSGGIRWNAVAFNERHHTYGG